MRHNKGILFYISSKKRNVLSIFQAKQIADSQIQITMLLMVQIISVGWCAKLERSYLAIMLVGVITGSISQVCTYSWKCDKIYGIINPTSYNSSTTFNIDRLLIINWWGQGFKRGFPLKKIAGQKLITGFFISLLSSILSSDL